MRRPAIALAFLLLAGCTSKPVEPAASPSPSPTTESPSPTAAPSYAVGAAFYADTFEDRSKGWPERDSDVATYVVHADYATPLYTVTAKKPSYSLFPHPSFRGVTQAQLADYHVVATLQSTLAVGHDDRFGVTCRDLDGARYLFEIGYDTLRTGSMPWAIVKHDAEGRHVLAEGETRSGGSAWEVGGTCAGGTGEPAHLVMSVNGTEVGRADDADAPLTKGYAGIYVFTKKGKTTVNVLSFATRSVTAA